MQQYKWHKTILQNHTLDRSARLMSTKPAKRNTNCLESEMNGWDAVLLSAASCSALPRFLCGMPFSSVQLYWYYSLRSAMLVHRCIRPRFAHESSRKSLHSWNWPTLQMRTKQVGTQNNQLYGSCEVLVVFWKTKLIYILFWEPYILHIPVKHSM